MVLDKKEFDKLSLPERQVVRQSLVAMFEKLDKINRKDNIEALKALENQGIDFIKPAEDSVDAWKKGVSNVPERLIEKGRLSRDILQTIQDHLKDFRSKHDGIDQ